MCGTLVWVDFKRLNERARVPEYKTCGAAGFDWFAGKDAILEPGEMQLIPTGISVAIPDGFEIQIRPRSGLVWNYGLTVANAPGTIDSDYRGEIRILLYNLGAETQAVHVGDRIAQGVIGAVCRANFMERIDLDKTERGAGGFGSTGVGGS